MRKLSKQELITAILCLAVAGGLLYMLWFRLPAEDPVARNVNAPKVPYLACTSIQSTTVDTAVLLVDLSDTVTFPHVATNEVIIKNLHYDGSLSDGKHWDIYLGVVLENDATDASVHWIHWHCRNRLASFDERRQFADFGLSLRVADETLVYATTNFSLTSSAIFSSGAVITSSFGTGSPAAGDVVALMDEGDDGALLEYTVCIEYDTE